MPKRDLMSEPRLRLSELADNPSNRVPICIVIDSSYSMRVDQKIKLANDGIRNFLGNACKDTYICDCLDVCIITFEKNGQVAVPFTNVSKIRFRDIEANGGSPLGKALTLANEQIEEIMQEYSSAGVTSFKPWLIVMSDGGCDDKDSLRTVTRLIREKQEDHALKVQCINLSKDHENDANLKNLLLSGDVRYCDALKIENFFSYLSRSAAELSVSTPNDMDEIKDFGLVL